MSEIALEELVAFVDHARTSATHLSTSVGAELDQQAAHAARQLGRYDVDLGDPNAAAAVLAAFHCAGNVYSNSIAQGDHPHAASQHFQAAFSAIVVHVAALHRDGDHRRATERVREFAESYADAQEQLLGDGGELDGLTLSQAALEVERKFRATGYLEALQDVLVLLGEERT